MSLTDYEKELITSSLVDTLFLVGITSIFVLVIGLLLGIFLFITDNNIVLNDSKPKRIIHRILSIITDVARSFPFIVLMIALLPFTKVVMGTIIGREAAIPALIISASPFFARLVFNSLRDVPKGTIEAIKSLGASNYKLMALLLKECISPLVSSFTVTLVTLIGFSAAAGAIGAGGLGDLSKQMAFSGRYLVSTIAVLLILIIVFVIQISGDVIAKKIDRR